MCIVIRFLYYEAFLQLIIILDCISFILLSDIDRLMLFLRASRSIIESGSRLLISDYNNMCIKNDFCCRISNRHFRCLRPILPYSIIILVYGKVVCKINCRRLYNFNFLFIIFVILSQFTIIL